MKTNCDITEACPSSSSCSWQRNARLSHWIWSGALSMWLSYNCFLCGPRGWALWMCLCAGLTYYYNSETKVSVWTKPGEEMASEVEEVDENEVQKAIPWLVLRWRCSSCVYYSQIQSESPTCWICWDFWNLFPWWLVALVALNSHHQITNQHQLGGMSPGLGWTAGPGGSARASSRESPDTNKGVQGGFLKELARTAQLTSSRMHSLELLEL